MGKCSVKQVGFNLLVPGVVYIYDSSQTAVVPGVVYIYDWDF